MLLRAAEHSKKMRKYTLWFAAVDTPENPAQVVKDPSKLNARLERFLQFHDQQTSGIPGLNLLYTGLKARVTEKLVKTKFITLLNKAHIMHCKWLGFASRRPAERSKRRKIPKLYSSMYIFEI